AGEVRHVGPQVGTDLVGDLPERGKVQLARVGRPAGDDHLGPVLQGRRPHGVHVDPVRALVHPVGGDVVQLAGEVDLHPVGEVPAVGELQAQDGVPRGGQRVQHGRVRGGTGVRLHVGVGGAEQGLGPVDGEVLGDVDLLAAAVVALARV